MNNGEPTRFLYDTESAIDLFICSLQLEAEIQWAVLISPGDGDHCPIIIAYDERENDRDSGYWEIKRARWDKYKTSKAWTELQDDVQGHNDTLINYLFNRIAIAASEAIPQSKQYKYSPKPCLNQELQQSEQRREQFYQQCRHNRTLGNLIAGGKQEHIISYSLGRTRGRARQSLLNDCIAIQPPAPYMNPCDK